MPIRASDSHVRSVAKAVSWRIVGSIDTFVVTLVITGNFIAAGSVAGLESVTKVILYYLHERLWSVAPPEFAATPAPSLGDTHLAPSINARRAHDDACRHGDATLHSPDAPMPAGVAATAPALHIPAALHQGAPRC
jgi:uncharacterized membrane protein